jgi:hypothetical protein
MKLSGHVSMVITAFGFMVLMLIVTTPAAGPGPGPIMDHGHEPAQNNITLRVARPPSILLIAGTRPSPDMVLNRLDTLPGL